MTMSVISLQERPLEINYFSAGFRAIIEDHLQILRNTAKLHTVEVSGFQELKYQGDFYGLLRDMGIDHDYHWITLRLNDLHSPMDYQGNLVNIKIPKIDYIKFLLRRYKNSNAFV